MSVCIRKSFSAEKEEKALYQKAHVADTDKSNYLADRTEFYSTDLAGDMHCSACMG